MATFDELVSAFKAAHAAGDTENASKLAAAIRKAQQQGAAMPSATSPTDTAATPVPQVDPTVESIDPSTLSQNQDWLAASKILFEYNEGRKWGVPQEGRTAVSTQGQGIMVGDPYEGYTDEQLAKYGLNAMGWFNYNMPVMGVDAARVKYAPEDFQKSFLYLMETYDALEMSWGGTGRFLKGAITDPSTYIGLGTFGIGTAVAQGGKVATKEGIKQTLKALLKQGVKRSIPLALEGGMYGAATSTARQSVEVSAGARESISGTQLATDAATGAAAGLVLGTGFETFSGLISRRLASKGGKAVVPDAAGNAGTAPTAPSASGAPVTYNRELTPEEIKLVHDDYASFVTSNGGNPNDRPLVGDEIKDWATIIIDDFKPVENPVAPNATAAVDPNVTPTTPAAPSAPSAAPAANAAPNQAPKPAPATLPGNLSGAKPRYNYGQKGFELQFESDIEKALFITSQQRKSARDGAYREWLKSAGYTDAEIDTLGKQVRDAIKAQAKDSTDPVLNIGRIAPDKQMVPAGEVNRRVPASRPEMTNVDAPNTTTAEDVIAALKQAAPDMEAGNVAKTRSGMFKQAEDVYNALRNLGLRSANDVADLLTRISMNSDQQTIIKVAVQQAAQNLTESRAAFLKVKNAVGSSADEVRQATEALKRIGPMQELLASLDKRISSPSGRDLGSRAGGMLVNENRGLSVESILEERKIDAASATVEELTAAENELIRRVDDFVEKARQNKEIRDLEYRAQEAHAAGNIPEAARLLAERNAILTARLEKEAKSKGWAGRAYDALNKNFISKLNEYIISTVFSPVTLVVNTVPALAKTIYKPALNMIVKGVGRAERAEAFHTYFAMMSHSKAAFNAAKMAFKYERSILTGEFDKFLEHGPAIKGMKGRVLRTFPRLLSATDEFFAQIHYRGYVVGDAAFQATEKGVQNGLTGKALDDFVKKEIEKAIKQSYELAPDTLGVVEMLRIKGAERGLKGDALDLFIKNELDRNSDLFRRATDEGGRNYADDILFKREFSGDGFWSGLAKGYEGFVNRHPISRLMGQLFFRTPVRVFEEGIRMTPGVQFIAPNFIGDLSGKNGVQAMVRAKGELLMSYGMMTSVVALYATGSITGSGPTDPKQRKMLEDQGWKPYSIRFSDGSYWSFRNMDPLSTPIKIMVNVLERMNDLEARRSQGEKTEGEAARVAQYASVAVASLTQAIRDASLTTGFDQLMDAWDAVTEDEDATKMQRIEKLIGKKLQLLVPSVVTKVINVNDPAMTNPAALEQYVMARINPSGGSVPKSYDALGRVRMLPNPYANLLWPFIASTKEDMTRNATEKEQVVLSGLSELAYATDTNFDFPYKMPGFDFDMRRRMTSDGKETLYDRAVRRYRELNPTDDLYELFKDGGLGGVGTKSGDGSRLIAVREIINQYRKAAFAQVMAEELNLEEELIQNKMKEAEARAGLRDSPFNPYSQ